MGKKKGRLMRLNGGVSFNKDGRAEVPLDEIAASLVMLALERRDARRAEIEGELRDAVILVARAAGLRLTGKMPFQFGTQPTPDGRMALVVQLAKPPAAPKAPPVAAPKMPESEKPAEVAKEVEKIVAASEIAKPEPKVVAVIEDAQVKAHEPPVEALRPVTTDELFKELAHASPGA